MAAPSKADDLGRLLHALLQPTALIELGIIAGCLMVAWGVVRLVRGPEPRRGSMWFGHGVVDGIFFPLLVLLLVLLARWVLQVMGQTVVPLAVFKLAVPIFISLAVIRLTVRVLRASFPASHLVRVVERSLSWVVWLGVVLWITGVLPLILQELDAIQWKIGAAKVSVRNILEGLVSGVLVLVVALWLSSLLEARLLRGAVAGGMGGVGGVGNLGVRKIAANVMRAVLLFVGLMFALSAAGIDLTALGVLGGAVGVGIGFGLQKLAANYVSGFVILAEQSMRIGDLVKVDNFEGRITDISTRYTVIRALNGREAIVPNEMMITQRVENASLADSRMGMNTAVQVAYGTDLLALMPRIAKVVGAIPRVLVDPAPDVLLKNFAADGLELCIGFWIADPENGQGNVRSDVNLAILKLFDELQVEIPFPQRVLRRASA